MVAKRVEAIEAKSKMPGVEQGMIEHLAGLVEDNTLRNTGRSKEDGLRRTTA
jgi:hypothetical protein